MPTGKGFADIVFVPRKGVDKPAFVVELKWDKSTEGAIKQIKDNPLKLALDGLRSRIYSNSIYNSSYELRDFTEPELILYDEYMKVSTKDILAAAADDRALFYAGRGGGIRKLRTDKLNNFLDGISVVKWQNVRTDGGTCSDPEFSDTDRKSVV